MIAVGYLPGVTDNVGRTGRTLISDVLDRHLDDDNQVFTETQYLVTGASLRRADVERLATELLFNELVERVRIWSSSEYLATPVDLELPWAGSSLTPRVDAIPLPASADQLAAISRQRTLSLSLAELEAIREHYRSGEVRAHRLAAGSRARSDRCRARGARADLVRALQAQDLQRADRVPRPRAGSTDSRSVLSSRPSSSSRPTISAEVDWLVSVFDDNAGVVRPRCRPAWSTRSRPTIRRARSTPTVVR